MTRIGVVLIFLSLTFVFVSAAELKNVEFDGLVIVLKFTNFSVSSTANS
jgi:uncharacterized membrane protein